jgi:hypothetical protein
MTANDRAHLLADGPCWELKGRLDSERFFEAIGSLLPEATTIFLEARPTESVVVLALDRHLQEPVFLPERGTYWPKTAIYQIPFKPAVLELLADFASGHAEPEICEHLHMYRGRECLLQWYDAFFDPVYLAPTVPQERVRHFAETVRARYRRCGAAV